jgi:hypothetical protein
MVGEDFAEGEEFAEFCCAFFSGEAGAEGNATAQIKSNVVGMRIRISKR